MFQKNYCFVTGSDQILLSNARRGFPGRRGDASEVDFHISPLSFQSFMQLVSAKDKIVDQAKCLNNYLDCGGYLRAINDIYMHGKVTSATIKTYADWLLADFEKLGKSSRTLVETLSAILKCLSSQVTYTSLLDHIQNISKPTLIEYMEILERVSFIKILYAYDHNKKAPSIKKARKIYFRDPFHVHVAQYLVSKELSYSGPILVTESQLVELVVVNEYAHRHPCFYHKGQGEIDLVVIVDSRPKFIEVKWSKQIRPKDLKELQKYEDTMILAKESGHGSYGGIIVKPLVELLGVL